MPLSSTCPVKLTSRGATPVTVPSLTSASDPSATSALMAVTTGAGVCTCSVFVLVTGAPGCRLSVTLRLTV